MYTSGRDGSFLETLLRFGLEKHSPEAVYSPSRPRIHTLPMQFMLSGLRIPSIFT